MYALMLAIVTRKPRPCPVASSSPAAGRERFLEEVEERTGGSADVFQVPLGEPAVTEADVHGIWRYLDQQAALDA